MGLTEKIPFGRVWRMKRKAAIPFVGRSASRPDTQFASHLLLAVDIAENLEGKCRFNHRIATLTWLDLTS